MVRIKSRPNLDSPVYDPALDPANAPLDLDSLLMRVGTKEAAKLKDDLHKLNYERAKNGKVFLRAYDLFSTLSNYCFGDDSKDLERVIRLKRDLADSAERAYKNAQDATFEKMEADVATMIGRLMTILVESGRFTPQEIENLHVRVIGDDQAS